jgi:hypothetical protein
MIMPREPEEIGKRETIVIAVITMLIMMCVGAAIISDVIKQNDSLNAKEFIVVKKEIVQVPLPYFFWWTAEEYRYYFADSTDSFVEVPRFVYDQYSIGDIYPNNYMIG